MPSADKRARKKENARAAREQREAALKRKKRTRSSITVGIVVALFVGVIVLLNVTGGSKKKATPPATSTTTTTDPKLDATKTYVATITTNLGVIKVQLDPKTAPIGAAHFADLINKHVYDGSAFRRVVKGFVIQGGAPGGDPTKNYGHPVVAEVPKGKYKLGDIAAAKGGSDPFGTFDSQFYVVTGAEGENLPDQYADFAHVVGGMDIVRKIEALPNSGSPNNDPTQRVTISKVTLTES